MRAMSTGADQKGLRKYGPARSWWDRGALVVDGAGAALVDADGCRVPIPLPPEGGVLNEHHTSVSGGGMPGRSWVLTSYNVCDRDGRSLAALPTDGFTRRDFQAFAEAAGLGFHVQTAGRHPPEVPGFVTFWPCTQTQEFRDRHPSHWFSLKLIGAKAQSSPYYGGRTYPPMTPSYLDG